ncbi:GntR family transcriptional regulator [Aureimonas endophytica]|uniref:GntR family transcriptional regulator n=1 Tax=Aureimonas endophytica TaxID=2027858 RepID=A0A917EDC5_9HYPH|nr:GntR family transcriptional regulator [Aureimonas endophytica]GGE21302.1 GntR family transcriptional regulator [Aureimonas endophytica]
MRQDLMPAARAPRSDVARVDASKAARVYAELREDIMSMRLRPGERLIEKDLCETLGVSRTPLRDAILRLAQERLVTVVPSDATFVNKIAADAVVEGQIVRESLELRMVALAAELFDPAFAPEFELVLFRERQAAERQDNDESFLLDNDFHRLVCECAGFPHVWETIRNATGQLDRVRRRSFPLQDFHMEVLSEHQSIFEALARRDTATATRLMTAHLHDNLRSLRVLLDREPELVDLDPRSAAAMLIPAA